GGRHAGSPFLPAGGRCFQHSHATAHGWEHVVMGETHVFRTPTARVLTIAIAIVAVIAMVYFLSEGGVLELWRSGPVVVLVVVLIWLVFWQPRVVVSDGGVTVANILRTVHVPWPQFTSVDSKWSLTVTAGEEKVSAW